MRHPHGINALGFPGIVEAYIKTYNPRSYAGARAMASAPLAESHLHAVVRFNKSRRKKARGFSVSEQPTAFFWPVPQKADPRVRRCNPLREQAVGKALRAVCERRRESVQTEWQTSLSCLLVAERSFLAGEPAPAV
jgi:hypothetical protein